MMNFPGKSVLIGAALLLTACAAPAGQAVNPTIAHKAVAPLNILFIMSDDHAVQALSAYGHPISDLAPTPNIDRIAQDGVLFANSFVTNSLCGPSRAALLTGQFGHVNGFRRNGDIFDGSRPTWPRQLKENGYQTAVVGKWHIGKTPEGLEFDHWKIFNDQGEYYNPDVITETGMARHEGYATDLVTEFGLDWLRNDRDPDRPFLLMVQHKAPHRNWMPALRHTQTFENVAFPLPDTYFDDYDGREAARSQEMNIYRDMYEGHDLKMTQSADTTDLRYDRWPDHFARMTPEQRASWDAAYHDRNVAMNQADFSDRDMAEWKYQRYLQDYLATIQSVDESVGTLLDYLDATGLSDNTLVIYTSDQGFYLGEHGWFDKRFMYEQSVRTPLLMRLPGRIPAGTTVDAMVQNIDLAPTFLDFAQTETIPDVQGHSLVDVARGDTPDDWRDAIYYQYFEFPGFHSVRKHYGVRTDRYKLIHFYGDDIDAWEFYDLEADPDEMANMIESEEYGADIAQLRVKLAQLRDQYRVPASVGRPE